MNYYQGELSKGYLGTRCYFATYKLKLFWGTMLFFKSILSGCSGSGISEPETGRQLENRLGNRVSHCLVRNGLLNLGNSR